jgi:ferredoxin-NADP reductase
MAEMRQAKVLAKVAAAEHGAILAFELDGHPELVLKGGKYIIIHTGLENADGKIIKRAYSLFAVKPESGQFFLAVAPVVDGVASHYLASLEPGDSLRFSGPWGRFHWPEGAQEKKVIAAAFGSGITGILGYLASVPKDYEVELLWYQDAPGGLVTDAMVRECLAQTHMKVYVRSMKEDPLNDFQAVNLTSRFVAAGEGQRVDRVFAYLRELGVSEEQLQSEIFYRNQDLSDAKADW